MQRERESVCKVMKGRRENVTSRLILCEDLVSTRLKTPSVSPAMAASYITSMGVK